MNGLRSNTAKRDGGSVLLLVLLVTSLLATAAWSYSDGVDSLVDNARDENGALLAEFAAESGMEYAQRRLTLEPDWPGTGPEGVTLINGVARFVVTTATDPNWQDEDQDGHDDDPTTGGGGEEGGGGDGESGEVGCFSWCICCGGVGVCPYDCPSRHAHRDDICEDADDLDGDDEDDCNYVPDCEDDCEDESDHSDCDHDGEHDDDHDGCDHDGDEADHDEDGCLHDHDSDGDCDHDGHHSDDDGDCDHDEDGDDDCGHDHDEDGDCDHPGGHDDDDEDPDEDCDHDDDGADDCGHDHDEDGFCDHDHDGDGHDDGTDTSENQVSLISVVGYAGEARAQLGAAVKVYPGESGTADLSFIFLGRNCHTLRTTILGDALFVDMADKVDDWIFDSNGVGRYMPGGSSHDGNTNLVQSVVDGTLYKFRDDLAPYQSLGAEEVIVDNAVAPAFDLSGFLEPGEGKVIYNGVTSLNGVHHEETAVFILNSRDKLTLKGCTLSGGVVVYCPTDYVLRNGYRNRVVLENGTTIGGGMGGAEANLGLLGPGVKLTSKPNSAYGLTGFTYVNEIGAAKNLSFLGQVVVLNQVSNLKDSTIIYDETVAMAPPQSVGFGTPNGRTDIISLFEEY